MSERLHIDEIARRCENSIAQSRKRREQPKETFFQRMKKHILLTLICFGVPMGSIILFSHLIGWANG